MSSSKSSTILDDLPGDLFAEILCRLPDPKHVVRCKFVSHRWRRRVRFLIRDPTFICRFIRFRRDSKTPITRTLLNHEGIGFRVAKAEELLTTMKMKAEEVIATVTMEVEKLMNRRRTEVGNDEALITTTDFTTIMTTTAERSLRPFSSKPLTPLFKRLIASMSGYGFQIVSPVVVATCNDLVLCRYKTAGGSNEYQICNPYTEESVALLYNSPSPYEFRLRSMTVEAVGFVCDLDQSGSRCKVVRIYGDTRQSYSELKVQIFSSETGVWRESIISFSQQIPGLLYEFVIYSYNGMLYWKADNKTIVGFDPFMINSTSSDDGNSIDHYKGRIIELADKDSKSEIEFVGICGGRLRFIDGLDYISHELPVWELEEKEDERAHDRSGKLVLKCTRYSLDREMFRDRDLSYRCATGRVHWLVFDPNDEDILYVYNMPHSELVFRCNIRTTEWSKVPYMSPGRDFVFQLTVLPWWPTPVPRKKDAYNVPYDPITNDAMRYFAGY